MTIVLTTGCYLNTSSVVHFCSSPLLIPDSFNEPFPCPFNTMDFGHSTARWFVGYSCKSPTKVHLLSETPSSSIQHVKELSLLLNLSVYFRTHSAPAAATLYISGGAGILVSYFTLQNYLSKFSILIIIINFRASMKFIPTN